MNCAWNTSVHRENHTAIHLPPTLQYCATPSMDEDLSTVPLIQDVLLRAGAIQMNNLQEYCLPIFTDNGSNSPFYTPTEYVANWETLVQSKLSFPLNGSGEQNNLHGAQLLDIDLLGLELGTIPAAQIPDQQLQRDFLQFLMKNLPLLTAVAKSTPDAMATVQFAFEQDIQRNGLIPPFAGIKKILQQFEPTIGSLAIRQESDSRKTKAVKRECPFQFCGGHFTRAAGLKNHLSAHFSLAPNECPRCGKYYSDVSFRRHLDNCRKAYSRMIARSQQT